MSHELPIEPPQDILRAYALDDTTQFELLTGGQVNTTYLAHTGVRRMILQRVNPELGSSSAENATIASEHLLRHDWEVPETIPSTEGEPFAVDDSETIWRLSSYIPSDGKVPTVSAGVLTDAAQLLGKWHSTTKTIGTTLHPGIAHFHDTDHYAITLDNIRNELPDAECQDFAGQLLDSYRRLPELPMDETQMIHGDPKLANMLFRDGKPFTLIDFDTVMEAPTWFDVGDLLRSGIQQAKRDGSPLSTADIAAIAEAYHDASDNRKSPEAFLAECLGATRRITTELAIRYLIDTAGGNYFTWDRSKFKSARDNHVPKILALIATNAELSEVAA